MAPLIFLVARVPDSDIASQLHYEELANDSFCVGARFGHPLQHIENLLLEDIARASWVLPPHGTMLRQQYDGMFYRAGLKLPDNVASTGALLLIISLLQHSDSLHLMPLDVARYYAAQRILTIMPISVPFNIDGFGIITRRGHLLPPSAAIVLKAMRTVAMEIY